MAASVGLYVYYSGLFGISGSPRDEWTKVAFLPDGKAVLAAQENGKVVSLDLASKEVRFTRVPVSSLTALAVAPDGKEAAIGDSGQRVHLLPLPLREGALAVNAIVAGDGWHVESVRYSPVCRPGYS